MEKNSSKTSITKVPVLSKSSSSKKKLGLSSSISKIIIPQQS